jgi:Kef-type K+ transport system membrane component KefB
MDQELLHLTLVCALLILPKALQRLRIPSQLTSFVMGLLVVLMHPIAGSGLVQSAAVLGISSLFLHAGLEVDFDHLRREFVRLGTFAVLRLASIAGLAWLIAHYLSMAWQPATLLAMAVLTSSTGFILDSLHRFVIADKEQAAIANEAIVGELLALALMFFVLQATDGVRLAVSVAAMAGLIVAVPVLYVALARWVVPYAPGSEFSLLVTVALAAAIATERLGVEFLLGAFIAGVTATVLRHRRPALLPDSTLHGVKLFSTFFMPFYFFRNGAQVPTSAITLAAAGVGLLLCLAIPLRFGATWVRRRLSGDDAAASAQVAIALSPTLIFTLVLAYILRARYALSDALLGGLLLYAFVNTLLPSLLLRVGIEDEETEGEGKKAAEEAKTPRPSA